MFFRSSKSESEPKAGSNINGGAKSSVQTRTTAEAEAEAEEGAQSAQLEQRATKSKQLQASFGEIVALLMRTDFKNAPIASLEQLVAPAIKTGQFMIAEAQAKRSGLVTPVAVVLWATVSEDVDRRLSEPGDNSDKLAPSDWKSGDIPWLILAAGDQRLIKTLLKRIQEIVLKGRSLKFRSPGHVEEKVEEAIATTTH